MSRGLKWKRSIVARSQNASNVGWELPPKTIFGQTEVRPWALLCCVYKAVETQPDPRLHQLPNDNQLPSSLRDT